MWFNLPKMPIDNAVTLAVSASESTTKFHFNPDMILQESGKNWQTFKCIAPGLLQAENFAWELVSGELKPDDPDEKKKEQWTIGNENARTVFFNTINPILFTSMFYDDSSLIKAVDIWSRLKKRFENTTRVFKQQAVESWIAFTFSPDETVEQNITTYMGLTYNLTESKAGISASAYSSAERLAGFQRSFFS